MATALAASFVHFVTTMAVALDIPKEEVIPKAIESMTELEGYSGAIYDFSTKRKEEFANEQQ